MTLTKSQIIDVISEANGFTRKKATETVETVFDIIKSTLASGEDVMSRGAETLQPVKIWRLKLGERCRSNVRGNLGIRLMGTRTIQ